MFSEGFNCWFDNAGGESGDAVFARLNVRAGVTIRSQIAQSKAAVRR